MRHDTMILMKTFPRNNPETTKAPALQKKTNYLDIPNYLPGEQERSVTTHDKRSESCLGCNEKFSVSWYT